MLRSLLTAFRRFDVSLWLGSWRLSVALMSVLALYQALLAVWATSTPTQVVANIASLTVFQLVYVLLLVNTMVCFWRRLPRLRSQLRDAGSLGRQFLALGSYFFHGAFLLVALGFLTSFLSHQETQIWVAEGERFTGEPQQILSQTTPRILSSPIPSPDFLVESITPELWNERLLFTALEAELSLPRGSRATTRINRPLWWGYGTFLRLSGFGYAPRWELRSKSSLVIDSAFAKLDVFPPGQRDYFQVPRYPHRFYVEVIPDPDEDGLTQTFNLVDPAVVLQVLRGRFDLGAAFLDEPDQGHVFEGLEMRFPEIRYWGQFSIVRDPGMPILFAGYALGLLGLMMKLVARSRET